MVQESGQTASEWLQVDQWVQRKYGVDGWWTCVQIDVAVKTFGRRVDSLLQEMTKKGKPKYKLDALLRNTNPRPQPPVTRLSRSSPVISAKPVFKRRKQETVKG